jgi:hypothetical protein
MCPFLFIFSHPASWEMLSGLSSHWNRQGRCGDATDLLTTRGTSAPVHQEDIERVETLPEEITAAKEASCEHIRHLHFFFVRHGMVTAIASEHRGCS